MDLNNLRKITEQNTNDAVAKQRHNQLLLDNTETQQVIVKSIAKLVEFLDKKVTRTEVVNQLKQIGTPDVQRVVKAVDSLHDTLKTHENTDLTEVTKLLNGMLDQLSQVPKELPKAEKQQFVDYSSQIKSLEETVKGVEKAIQAQKLNVEAPVVNVEPVVNVDAPNLKPIQDSVVKGSSEVVKAVKGIKLPELNTDPVEKLLKKTNKLLEELPDLMPSGGGGSGSSWVAVNEDGTPIPLNTVNGGLTTESVALATRIDDTADPIIYIGKAVVGASEASAIWQIAKLDTSSGLSKTWAGTAGFTQVWANRAGLTYN
jgi:hypothetical protein